MYYGAKCQRCLNFFQIRKEFQGKAVVFGSYALESVTPALGRPHSPLWEEGFPKRKIQCDER